MRRRAALLAPLAIVSYQAGAQATRQIGWTDLLPQGKPFVDPIAALPQEQQLALIQIAAMRDRRSRGAEITPEDVTSERQALAGLESAKLNADDLLARRKDIAAARIAHASRANAELDKQLVRMAGYMLPLEFNSKMMVVEFLLVPFVGACIHVPPPPPNQIVHVKAGTPLDLRTFDAVWISGRLTIGATKRELDLVDGSADIEVGYSMTGAKVEKYKAKG